MLRPVISVREFMRKAKMVGLVMVEARHLVRTFTSVEVSSTMSTMSTMLSGSGAEPFDSTT